MQEILIMEDLNFYCLTTETEPELAGRRGAIPPDYNAYQRNSQTTLQKDKLPSYNPVFSDLVLRKDHSLSDFIWDKGAIGGIGFTISEKVKNILEGYNLPIHRYYPLNAIYKGKKTATQYYRLQIIEQPNYNWVDFKNSQFVIDKKGADLEAEDEIIMVENELVLKSKIGLLPFGHRITFEKLVFNSNFLKENLDIFVLKDLHSSFYWIITKRLKERLEAEKITGLYEWKQVPIIFST